MRGGRGAGGPFARRASLWAISLLLTLGAHAAPAQQGRFFGLADPVPPVDPVMPSSPPPLSASALIDIDPDAPAGQRVAIDADSLAIDRERLVRYTLVVVGSGGARNLSYEALRCDTQERRILALGRPDGSWSIVADGPWRRIDRRDGIGRHPALVLDRLCEGGAAGAPTPQRLAARLRQAPAGRPAL
jgi:hypothetical protein